jgi:hypothetical protein
MPIEHPLQVERLLRALDAHRVEYVIIGGVAVAIHGYLRATKDLDIMIAPDPENVARLWGFIEEVAAEPLAIGDFEANEMPLPFEPQSIIDGGGNWLLRTTFGRIDVMQYAPGAPEYEELADRSSLRELSGMAEPVRVCSFDDLIAMKRTANRDVDRIDLQRLLGGHGLDGA